MKNPEQVRFRDYVELVRENKITSLVAVVMFAAMIAVTYAAASIARDNTVHAHVGPRPTVQRVEIFTCTEESVYECADRLKGQYERWVKSASDVRISDRQVSVGVGQSDAGQYGGHRDATVVMTLSVFYERLVGRSADEKPPAEKP